MIDQAVHVGRRAEVQPAVGHAADGAGLRRQGQIFNDLFFIGHARHAFRHADAEIDHTVGREFEGRPAGDDLPRPQFHRRNGLHGDLDLPAERRVVTFGKRLPVMLGRRQNDAIHQDPRNLHLTAVQGPPVRYPFHLDNNKAAGILCRHGHGQGLQGQGLLFHGNVTVHVRCCPPDNGGIDGKCLVEQIFLTTDPDQFNDVPSFLKCFLIQLTAVNPGINEGSQPHAGNGSGLVGGDVPEEMRNDPLGHIVAEYEIFPDQAL